MARKPRSFRAEAVVLRHSDWGEADRLLSLYTRKIGRVRAIAKGVRKIHSRKAGHLEPFTRAKIQFARGRDLYIITQAETIDAYLPLRGDLILMGYASYTAELLDRFTQEGDENLSLYHLLTETLARLSSGPDPALVVRYFEVHLLEFLGYRPKLFQCTQCDNEIRAQNQFFSPAHGGVVCPQCGPKTSNVSPILMDTLRFLRHFQRSTFREAARAQIPAQIHQDLERLMANYLTYTLEQTLHSPAFLQHVRGYHE